MAQSELVDMVCSMSLLSPPQITGLRVGQGWCPRGKLGNGNEIDKVTDLQLSSFVSFPTNGQYLRD